MEPLSLVTLLVIALAVVLVLYLLCSGALGGMMAGVMGTPAGWVVAVLALLALAVSLAWPR